MGLSRPISDIIGEFLSKEVDDEKTLIGLFIKTLRELVKIGQLKEKHNNLFSVNEPQTNIYIVDDEVWIRYQLVSNHIVPQMFTELKPRQVLGYLKNAGMLVLNKGSYECRRSVKNSKKQENPL